MCVCVHTCVRAHVCARGHVCVRACVCARILQLQDLGNDSLLRPLHTKHLPRAVRVLEYPTCPSGTTASAERAQMHERAGGEDLRWLCLGSASGLKNGAPRGADAPRRPAARQSTQSTASLAHLRQPSQIRRRGLADRKHAVAAADNVQQTRWTMQHAADRMHHTARSRRHAQLAAATPTPHAQPATCQSAWCAANHSSCAYAQRRGGPGRALGLTPATTCTAVRASRRRSSCQAASRGADVGRVAAQTCEARDGTCSSATAIAARAILQRGAPGMHASRQPGGPA